MLFLLNDWVLNLAPEELQLPLDDPAMASVRTDIVSGLCAELFIADPTLHRTNPEKAKKVIALVLAKVPSVNAALFMPAFPGCPIAQVSCRFAEIGFDVLSRLFMGQSQGRDTGNEAEREVWRRLAA